LRAPCKTDFPGISGDSGCHENSDVGESVQGDLNRSSCNTIEGVGSSQSNDLDGKNVEVEVAVIVSCHVVFRTRSNVQSFNQDPRNWEFGENIYSTSNQGTSWARTAAIKRAGVAVFTQIADTVTANDTKTTVDWAVTACLSTLLADTISTDRSSWAFATILGARCAGLVVGFETQTISTIEAFAVLWAS